MTSRMDKYYSNDIGTKKRSQRNEQLYREIYDNVSYSNIEGVATIDNGNEIDINKVKQMLKGREANKEIIEKKYFEPTKTSVAVSDIEEKSYDIRDILNKAKENKNTSDKYHTINNTDYDIFKDLRDRRRKDIEKDGESEQQLRTLIDTITNTSTLNQLEDKELSLDLLDDLKSSDNTVVTTRDSVKAIIEEAKRQEQKKEEPKMEVDKSFYTSSLNFKEEDFEQLADLNSTLKKNNGLIKILLFIILAAVAVGIIILVFNLLK